MEQPPREEEPENRFIRRALIPIGTNIVDGSEENITPPVSPDEYVIQQRGRRRKPITWSPVDYNKTNILGPPRDKTPEEVPRKVEISLRLRRRLIMSPNRKSVALGKAIEKRLQQLYGNESNKHIQGKME